MPVKGLFCRISAACKVSDVRVVRTWSGPASSASRHNPSQWAAIVPTWTASNRSRFIRACPRTKSGSATRRLAIAYLARTASWRLAAHDLRLIGVADLYGMNGDGVNRLAIRK
jgi:hypothetical protein